LPGPGNWYVYNFLITIPENPAWELIQLEFPESTNIEEIVIDTICIPEPVSVALLGLGLVPLLLRRKK
jgi:hypothetical protein